MLRPNESHAASPDSPHPPPKKLASLSGGKTSSGSRKSLLILLRDAAQSSALAAALRADEADLSSRPAAIARIAELRPDFVLATAADARKLVRDLDRVKPETHKLFLCAQADTEGFTALTRLAAEGQVFSVLDADQPQEALVHQIKGFLEPRRSIRLSPTGVVSVRFELNGMDLEGTLLDLSARGMGLLLPLETNLDLEVGAVLSNVRAHNGSLGLLESGSGVVRHSRVHEGGIEVGIKLLGGAEDGREISRIADPTRIAALVQRSTRRAERMLLRPVNEDQEAALLTSVRFEQVAGMRLLTARVDQPDCVGMGTVHELRFEFNGRGYWGNVAVLSAEAHHLVLSLPSMLFQAHRRSALRHQANGREALVVALTPPFSSQLLLRRAIDHHGNGLSIAIDAAREAFPPGLMLGAMTVTLPGGKRFDCRGQVRNVWPLPQGSVPGMARPCRVGIRLLDPSDELRAALVAPLAATEGTIEGADGAPFSEIWQLMAASGRTFQNYSMDLRGPHLDVLSNAQRGLERAHGALGKSFLCRSPNPVGFASGLRVYSRTWMFQHLTMLPGYRRDEPISQQLAAMVIEYGESMADIDFIRYVWFEGVRWTSRFSTFMARQLATDGLTDLREVHYMQLDPSVPLEGSPATVRVAPGSARDHLAIERHFRSLGDRVRIRSDDLTAKELDLSTLSARSKPFGLSRSRTTFVVNDGEGLIAFALAEHATPGLSWQEFTNSFRLYSVRTADPVLAERALLALAKHCARLYREHGQPYAVAMASQDQIALLQRLGFGLHGHVTEWTFHKKLVRSWTELTSAIVDRLKRDPSVERRQERAA